MSTPSTFTLSGAGSSRALPPRDEVPGFVATPDFTAVGRRAVVFTTGVRVFSTGVEIRFEIRFPATEELSAEFAENLAALVRDDRRQDPDRLRVSLRYADGRVAANHGPHPAVPVGSEDQEPAPFMTRSGAPAAFGGRTEFSYWICPVPRHADAVLSIAWPALDLDPVDWELDHRAVEAAFGRVHRI